MYAIAVRGVSLIPHLVGNGPLSGASYPWLVDNSGFGHWLGECMSLLTCALPRVSILIWHCHLQPPCIQIHLFLIHIVFFLILLFPSKLPPGIVAHHGVLRNRRGQAPRPCPCNRHLERGTESSYHCPRRSSRACKTEARYRQRFGNHSYPTTVSFQAVMLSSRTNKNVGPKIQMIH
jgi:hypothetical protein